MRPRSPIHWRIPALLLPVFFASAMAAAPAASGPIPGVNEIPRPPADNRDLPISKENLVPKTPKKEEPKKEEPKKEEPKKEEPKKEEPKKEEPKKEEPKKEEPKKEEPKKEEPKKEEPKKEEPKKEQEPVVRKLRFEPHPTKKYTIVLKWEVDPANKAPIYVGRYRERVRTRDQVLDADNLTAPALGPQVTTFTDSKIPDGSYYYVLVTAEEMKPSFSILLKGDQNTTTTPAIIKRRETDIPTKGADGPPAVRNIKILPHPDQKGAVVLTWDIAGKASDTIILRHRKPIADEAAFRAAKRVAALRSWARHYIDREVAAGSYYYAAYLQRETRGDLTLKEAQNYTTEPFISDYFPPKKEADPNASAGDFAVRGLTAVNGQASVKLSWRAARASSVLYRVYRGSQPLDDGKALARARLLIELEDRVNFEDVEALADQKVYYGVTVTDRRTGREYTQLQEGVGFRAHVYQPRAASKDLEHLLPDALTTFLKDSKTIMLFWAEPDSKVEGYRVYRHDRPIDNEARLKDSKLVGRIEGAANRFQDSDAPAGNHYYALLPLNEQGGEIREFVERRTFTGFGIEIEATDEPKKEEPKKEEPKKEEPKKEEPKQVEARLLVLRAAMDERDIVVSWEADVPTGAIAKVRLYRALEPLQTLQEVEERGILVRSLDPALGVLRDTGLKAGLYYYAALLEVNGKLQDRMLLGRNYLAQGVRVGPVPGKKEGPDPGLKKEPTKTDTGTVPSELALLRELDGVLRRTYGRRRYAAAVRELHSFGRDRRYPGRVRAKAMFYTGLAYYRMGRHRDSIEYFLNFRVQDEYPRRSRFYYRRALERLR